MDQIKLDLDKVKDISAEVLDENGRMQILPAAYWAGRTDEERMLFCHLNGIYSIPTVELVEQLREKIGDRKAIEIGAGNGVLAEALGIIATDSYQQEMDKYRPTYATGTVPPARYGAHVIKAPADRAVRKYQPDVVLACWVTHKWDASIPMMDGNEKGVDEGEVLRNCREYIFVGNEQVHRWKPIWKLPHTIEYPDYLFARKFNQTRNFIATWKGLKR